jgi:hypothetical protein
MKIKTLALSIFSLISFHAHATNLMGRMGVGLSNQFVTDQPAISFKVQNSRLFSWGGLLAIDANNDDTDYGFGLKAYRHLFDEPNLNFFVAGMAAILQKAGDSGYQLDGTFGTEFHIPGLESIGFSFEAGLSINKIDDQSHIETLGNNIVKAAVHFYL